MLHFLRRLLLKALILERETHFGLTEPVMGCLTTLVRLLVCKVKDGFTKGIPYLTVSQNLW